MPDGSGYSGPAVGIDLGTSNTVAVVRQADGRVRPLLFDGLPVTPSAVYLDEDGHLHVGQDAFRLAQVDPARCEPNPKRRIDDHAILLGDREVPVADALAAILRSVAAKATEACGTQPPVVLTYPATWGARRRHTLRTAAALAGWPEAVLLPEPIAAAHFYVDALAQPLADGSALAVFDFGGGTVDVAVVGRVGGRFVVRGAGGLPELGGLDVDATLVGHLGAVLARTMPEHWRQISAPRTASERRQRRAFWEDVRGAKEMLSRTAMAPVIVPGADRPVHLTREELESLARPLIRQVVAFTADTIDQCGIKPVDLAGLFMVGGASRIPLVAQMLHARLGVAPTVLEQPELPVAEGALAAVARGAYTEADSGPPAPPGNRPATPEPTLVELVPQSPVPLPAPAPPPAQTRWRAVAGVPARAPSEETTPVPGQLPSPDTRRHRRTVLVAGAVVLVLVAGLVAVVLLYGRRPGTTASGASSSTRETGSFPIPAGVAPYLDIDHDFAYVGLPGAGKPEVTKIALATGQRLWTRAAGSGQLASLDAGPSVIVVRSVAAGTDPAPVTVLDTATGDPLWNFTARQADQVHLLGERVLFFDRTGDRLIGYERRTGQELWQHGLSGSTLIFGTTWTDEQNARSADGQRIFSSDSGTQNKIFRLDANGAARVLDTVDRSVDARGADLGKANDLYLTFGDLVLAVDNRAGYTVRAYRLSDLGLLWTSKPQAGGIPQRLDPCGEHRLCVLDSESNVAVFDLASGALNWTRKLPEATYTASVGALVMATYRRPDGRLGTALWNNAGDEVANQPGTVAGRLDGTHLLLFTAAARATTPATVGVARLDVTTNAKTDLGTYNIDVSRCAYNSAYLTCPTPDAVKVWRL